MLEILPVSVLASPCINVCELDAEQNCVGCGRSLSEIAEWSQASNGRRRQICAEAERRLSAIQSAVASLKGRQVR